MNKCLDIIIKLCACMESLQAYILPFGVFPGCRQATEIVVEVFILLSETRQLVARMENLE